MANEPTLEELLSGLHQLERSWKERAQEASARTDQQRLNNPQEAYYYRGLLDGLKIALQGLQTTLGQPASVEPKQATPPQTYVIVEKDIALAVLKRAGLLIAELREHPDHTFSAFFSPLQVTSFDDRINRLSATADVEILDYGKLPNNSKTYLDFGFKTPPGN